MYVATKQSEKSALQQRARKSLDVRSSGVRGQDGLRWRLGHIWKYVHGRQVGL